VSSHGPARRPRHATTAMGHPVLRTFLAVVAGAVGFAVVLGFSYGQQLQSRLDANSKDISSLLGPASTDDSSPVPSVTEDTTPTDAAEGKALNILLIGSDTRGGDNADVVADDVEGMRSDTTLVMHISADRTRVEFLSIPRDSRVAISDCNMFDGSVVKGWTAKFNTAFANGGQHGDASEAAACTMKTITDLTGLTFDHYAVVDFAGFRTMIDAVGGVPMCIEERVRSKKSHLSLQAGPRVLDGKTALAWARARTGIGLGDGTDLMRIDRQHELLENLARKSLGLNLLTDAGAATLLIRSAAESMTMDTDLASVTYLLGLAYSMRNIDTDKIVFETVPWMYPGDKSGDVVWKDSAIWKFKRLSNDQPLVDEESTDAPTPDASSDPSATATPQRETEKDILAECEV